MAARKRSREHSPDADETNLASSLFGSHSMVSEQDTGVIGEPAAQEASADFALDTEGSTFPEADQDNESEQEATAQQAPGTKQSLWLSTCLLYINFHRSLG